MMEVKQYLKSQGIEFKEFNHEPVFTVQEAKDQRVYENIKGVHSKNLFIKDRKSKKFYIIIMPEDKKLDLNEMGEKIGNKIKFANEEDLKNILGLTAGSVSPFGLINDKEHKVKVMIDKEVWNSKFVSFHPNINTETLELSGEDFHKFIKSLKNEKEVFE